MSFIPKRDVKREAMEKLLSHPTYKQVISHLSGTQRDVVEMKVSQFLETFVGSAFEGVSSLDENGKEKLRQSILQKHTELWNKVVKTKK